MKRILLICILLFKFVSVYSQTGIIINKQIVDKNSITPISTAHIYLKKYSTGTITNEEGIFELKIPTHCKNDTLTISCIGYETLNILISDIKSNKILLTPKINILEEVSIISNYNPEKILKKVYKKRNINYPYSESYSAKIFYRDYFKKDDKTVQMLELQGAIKEKGIKYNPYDNSEFNIDTIYHFYRSNYEHIYASFDFVGILFFDGINNVKKGQYLVDSIFYINNEKLISITFIPAKSDTITYETYEQTNGMLDDKDIKIELSSEKINIKTEKSYQYQLIEHYVINLNDYAITNFSVSYNLMGKPESFALKINKNYSKISKVSIQYKKIGSKYYPKKISEEKEKIFVKKYNLDETDYKLNYYSEYYFYKIDTVSDDNITKYKYLHYEEFVEKYKDVIYPNKSIDIFNDTVKKIYLQDIKDENIIFKTTNKTNTQ